MTDDLLKENGIVYMWYIYVYYEDRRYQSGGKIDIFIKVITEF